MILKVLHIYGETGLDYTFAFLMEPPEEPLPEGVAFQFADGAACDDADQKVELRAVTQLETELLA